MKTKITENHLSTNKSQAIQALLAHPVLWQASSYQSDKESSDRTPIVKTGFSHVDTLLSYGGWPLGHLIECLTQRVGHGELELFFPAIKQLLKQNTGQNVSSPVALIAPPYTPYEANWSKQYTQTQLWIITPTLLAEQLWAAEQILRSNSVPVIMIWLHHQKVRPTQLRKLQLAARYSRSLVLVMRDSQAQQQHSPAPLRIALTPQRKSKQTAIAINILKQPGNWGGKQTSIRWHRSLQQPALPTEQWPVYRPDTGQDINNNGIDSTQSLPLPTLKAKWS